MSNQAIFKHKGKDLFQLSSSAVCRACLCLSPFFFVLLMKSKCLSEPPWPDAKQAFPFCCCGRVFTNRFIFCYSGYKFRKHCNPCNFSSSDLATLVGNTFNSKCYMLRPPSTLAELLLCQKCNRRTAGVCVCRSDKQNFVLIKSVGNIMPGAAMIWFQVFVVAGLVWVVCSPSNSSRRLFSSSVDSRSDLQMTNDKN